MKSIIGLSLAAFSFQGIIMGSYDRKFDNFRPNNEMINQRPIDNGMSMNDAMIIKQRPMNDDVIQRPIMTNPIFNQAPIVNQAPFANQIPIIKHGEMEHMHRYPIGYVRPPVINIQQPIYPQPISTIGIVNPTPISVVPITTSISDGSNMNFISQNRCRVTGQYNQLCVASNIFVNENLLHNAPYKRSYKCLKNAICTFTDNGCKWYKTNEYKKCIRRIINRRSLFMNENNMRTNFLGA